MSDFGNRLKKIIDTRGVTQRWLAEKSGTTEASISRYTSSKQEPPFVKTLKDMAISLGVSADYLVGVTNVETPNPNFPEDILLLVQAYTRASDADKAVLWALFGKYLSPLDKDVLNEVLSNNDTN